MTTFSLRQCFRLCLPALIIGALLRIAFMAAAPEVFFGSDSPSYFKPARTLWAHHHRMAFNAKRRWLYPILLMATPVLPVAPVYTIPVAQHLLGLFTLFGVGWIVGNLTRLKSLWVPLATTAIAIWPKLLWYEHEVVAEPLFLASFVLTVALAFPYGSLKNQNRLFWFLLAAAAMASIKPHGRGLWLGCLIAATAMAGNPLKWRPKCWGAIAGAAVIMFTSGQQSQGSWLLLNSTLPLVDLDAAKYHEYREVLRPCILKARSELDQYAWTQGIYKKPLNDDDPSKIGPLWASLCSEGNAPLYVKVCHELAFGGIRAHPFTFARLSLTKIGISLDDEGEWRSKLDPADMWAAQKKLFPQTKEDYEEKFEILYRMPFEQFSHLGDDRMVRTNPTLPFLKSVSKWLAWTTESRDAATRKYSLALGWMGALAILGLCACLAPSRFLVTMILWLPAILCLVTVHAVGDRNSQYVQPVEWVGVVLIAIGLDWLVAGVGSLLIGKKGTPLEHPETAKIV